MAARGILRTLLTLLVAAAIADSASALPTDPWTGRWLDGTGAIMTLTQSGSQITGSSPCPGSAVPNGVTQTGTASTDNATANFTYSSTVCTGTGGTYTAKLSPDGKTASGSGVTQYGTGFSFSWTYQSGGTEPRVAPPPPPPPASVRTNCPGGPWSGLWTAAGSSVFSFTQNGSTLSGTIVGESETINGTIAGDVVSASFRIPEGTGTLMFTIAPDHGSFVSVGTTTTGQPSGPRTSTFVGCSSAPTGANLGTTIPAPQVVTAGPTSIVAPGTVSVTSFTRSKCVLVSVASGKPARILVSIFSGNKSIRLFGQKRVVFLRAGRRRVCVPVPYRAHSFDVRSRLNVGLGYVVGATVKPGERKPAPVIKRINLVP